MIAAPHAQVFAAQSQVRGSLEVRVVDRNRKPIDAIVIVKGGSGWAGRTNAMGYYSVNVPPGSYLVSVSYRGHSAAQRVRVYAGRAKRITIAFRVADSNALPAANGGSTRSGQRPAASAVPPNGAPTSGSTHSGSTQRPPSSPKPAPGVTTGTSSTPAPAPESTQEPAQTPTPAKPTPPGKPAKVKALTADPPVTEPGGTSRITAEVVNPDGVPLTFSWAASGGSVSGADAQALWVAPQSTGEFTISVVVKDSKGRTTSGSIGVHVQGGSSKPAPTPTPTAPQITALTADPTVTPPGGTSSITAEVANPDNVPLTFSWVASGGTITGAQAQALWVAPQSTGQFTVSVVAKDSYGRTANGSIGVNVQTSSPAPAPAPTPTGTRDPATWPFDKLSPWNYPIGSGAVYEPIRSALTGRGFRTGGMNTEAYTAAIWIASASDPMRKIYRRDRNMAYLQRRIPDAAVASRGTDGYMAVISPDHLTAFEMMKAVKRPDGDWECSGAAVDVDLRGMGLNLPGGSGLTDGFASTYGGSSVAGVIRAGELRNSIKHALHFTSDPRMWNRNAPGGRSFVWPASSSDNPVAYGTSGNLYLGSLVAIPPGVNINALGLETPEGLVLARALQDYGAYGVTSGGVSDRIVFRYDYSAKLAGDIARLVANWDPFQRDMNRLAGLLQVVANSHNEGKQPVVPGGGGTPRMPPPPDFMIGQGHLILAIAGYLGVRRSAVVFWKKKRREG